MNRIYRNGMTTLSGGNLSIKDTNGDIWITPAGVDKGQLTANDIMCVQADGSVVGPHRPSSEYPFHRAIYAQRPDLCAIVHAHPPAMVTFSIVRQIPETSIIPHPALGLSLLDAAHSGGGLSGLCSGHRLCRRA